MRFRSEEGKQGKIRGNVDKINRESVKFINIMRFFHMEEIFRLAALAMSFMDNATYCAESTCFFINMLLQLLHECLIIKISLQFA